MPHPSPIAQLLAKNPRRQARFPDVPVDQALRELEEMQKKLSALPRGGTAPAQPPPENADLATALNGSVANIVTNLWRAKAKMIEQLRSKGYAPFNEYKVDFFIALPDEGACQSVRSRLEADGFSVDAKPMTEKTDLPFSLHASKSMRLIVPDMQDLSQRLTVLAGEFGGRYDGWAA